MGHKKTLLIDFDGVLHSYTSGWQGAATISDPPVDGAMQWLAGLVLDGEFDVCIYSSRSGQHGGVRAMKKWLNKHMPPNVWDTNLISPFSEHVRFPTEKPGAFLTIDDRAICFQGDFPSLDEIREFKSWNRR